MLKQLRGQISSQTSFRKGNEDIWDMSLSCTEQTHGRDYQRVVPVTAHAQNQSHKVRATNKRETESRREKGDSLNESLGQR